MSLTENVKIFPIHSKYCNIYLNSVIYFWYVINLVTRIWIIFLCNNIILITKVELNVATLNEGWASRQYKINFHETEFSPQKFHKRECF